jgi:hypothetical protein
LLPLSNLCAAAPADSARVPKHATVIDQRDVASNYTFIIAGGGIAGLTLADRLTEDPNGMLVVRDVLAGFIHSANPPSLL